MIRTSVDRSDISIVVVRLQGFNRDVVNKQAGRFAADITHDPELAERNGDDDCDQQTEDNVFVTDFCLENSF